MASSLPSFRDPSGSLYSIRGRIIRTVRSCASDDLHSFLDSVTARRYIEEGRIVSTRVLDPSEYPTVTDLIHESADGGLVDAILEHERISFPSFPAEWAPEMLYAAADFTLELAETLLDDEIGIKDATPYNVLFSGPKPVFIDILSFEKRSPGDSVWLPYAQFLRTFLLPLLANSRFSIPLDQVFTTRRDGLEPEDIYRLSSPLQRISPSFLTTVSLPVWLNNKAEASDGKIYEKKLLPDADRARFMLKSNLRSLRKSLERFKPRAGKASVWSEYAEGKNSYQSDDFKAKDSFLKALLDEFHPRHVLDVGCNTGYFSFLAAEKGSSVVSVDYDPVVIGNVWREAAARNLDVLPLVVNLARPTPSVGWRNMENASFIDRARGSFDCVFMLALIHHLMVSEMIPLSEVISIAAELTTDLLVVEYVDPSDPMFRRLTRGRASLFEGLNRNVFEEACSKHFEIVRSLSLDNTNRSLYLLRKVGS